MGKWRSKILAGWIGKSQILKDGQKLHRYFKKKKKKRCKEIRQKNHGFQFFC